MSNGVTVYLLAATTGGAKFPNLHIIGVFSSRQKAIETLRAVPRNHAFILYEAPIDRFWGFIDQSGRLLDGMGSLPHKHYLPEEPVPETEPHDTMAGPTEKNQR